MIRTRFAPSPTGFMHIGNLRTALYEYLIAKSGGGSFILRIEDTDRERLVEGSLELIYKTLEKTGLKHDEGPDVGGNYGPYVQSERKGHYLAYAEDLVKNGTAYYCFCPKERLESLHDNSGNGKYDRHCLSLSKEEIAENLKNNVPYVIRQLIPDGNTTFHDEVFADITVDNSELDDMILIKSDGYPTYNFANVIDDHLMEITHVIRGSEYLSSTPKYNLLYNAFGWDIPTYIHLPLILNSNGEKLSKRRGDASFEDLVKMGYLPEAIINYIALLGWSPNNNREIFSLQELTEVFSISGLSKSPSTFDLTKLTWMNGEYFKKMETENFLSLAEPLLKEGIKREDIDLLWLCNMLKTRVEFVSDIADMIDFIDKLPDYSPELYVHKKMKTTLENSKESLEKVLPLLREAEDWTLEALHKKIMDKIKELDIKNGQMLWPIRTALSGKPTSPCGATELAVLLGKDETLRRIEKGIEVLS